MSTINVDHIKYNVKQIVLTENDTYDLLPSDDIIEISGDFTLTLNLPLISSLPNAQKRYMVSRVSGTGVVTLATDDTIGDDDKVNTADTLSPISSTLLKPTHVYVAGTNAWTALEY